MSTLLPKHKFVEKLLALQKSGVPILFSLSVRTWPGPSAKGHGVLSNIDGDTVQIEGRSGSLRLVLENDAEYRITGHSTFSETQKAYLPDDLYFRRLKRVRALLVTASQWEASLVFACGVKG